MSMRCDKPYLPSIFDQEIVVQFGCNNKYWGSLSSFATLTQPTGSISKAIPFGIRHCKIVPFLYPCTEFKNLYTSIMTKLISNPWWMPTSRGDMQDKIAAVGVFFTTTAFASF